MTTITDADRDAAAPFLWCMDFATHQELMEVFARHREAALEEAARAFKSAQYSPAPYTDGMKALRRLMDDPA